MELQGSRQQPGLPQAAGGVKVTNHALPEAEDSSTLLRRVENVGGGIGWVWFNHYVYAVLGG